MVLLEGCPLVLKLAPCWPHQSIRGNGLRCWGEGKLGFNERLSDVSERIKKRVGR